MLLNGIDFLLMVEDQMEDNMNSKQVSFSRSICLSFMLGIFVLVASVGCGGAMGRMVATQRLPALQVNATPADADYPKPETLKAITLAAADWAAIKSEKTPPICDFRDGKRDLDKAGMSAVREALGDSYKELDDSQREQLTNPLGATLVGVKGLLGPSTDVETVSIDCAGDKVLFVVNGMGIAADVVFGSGAMHTVVVEAVSLVTGDVMYAQVGSSGSSFIATNVRRYLPEALGDIVVHPIMMGTTVETFITRKAAPTGGAYIVAPVGGAGQRSTYGVARFDVQ
jgi:hypothetical protein